ncbi:hypothetical protein [Streptomyces smyrnaeus]|uniref:Uncharacterized protein n=1 Tax=Streptomyces smyrnaeus TaxID=1387713 RepID=A0ABS3Y4Z3_9ACTN|nr:hypothetical protein [Streptomyces smyrnaeus]MBO8202730.1 hypothetical protein [Streptomyces smyrnaeus]
MRKTLTGGLVGLLAIAGLSLSAASPAGANETMAGWNFKCLDPVKSSQDPGGWNVTVIGTRDGNRAEYFHATFLAHGEKVRIVDERNADGNPGPSMKVEVYDFTAGKMATGHFGASNATDVYDIGGDDIGKPGNIPEGHKMRIGLSSPGAGGSGLCRGGVS